MGDLSWRVLFITGALCLFVCPPLTSESSETAPVLPSPRKLDVESAHRDRKHPHRAILPRMFYHSALGPISATGWEGQGGDGKGSHPLPTPPLVCKPTGLAEGKQLSRVGVFRSKGTLQGSPWALGSPSSTTTNPGQGHCQESKLCREAGEQ